MWRDALLLAKPETLLRWHREGFRLWWRWRSRSRRSHEPRVAPNVIALIRRMAKDNRLWGAERIRGEPLKLGIRVAKRTVQRYMLPQGAAFAAPATSSLDSCSFQWLSFSWRSFRVCTPRFPRVPARPPPLYFQLKSTGFGTFPTSLNASQT